MVYARVDAADEAEENEENEENKAENPEKEQPTNSRSKGVMSVAALLS
jgi:hypothetical protein